MLRQRERSTDSTVIQGEAQPAKEGCRRFNNWPQLVAGIFLPRNKIRQNDREQVSPTLYSAPPKSAVFLPHFRKVTINSVCRSMFFTFLSLYRSTSKSHFSACDPRGGSQLAEMSFLHTTHGVPKTTCGGPLLSAIPGNLLLLLCNKCCFLFSCYNTFALSSFNSLL